ncbi:PDZ domain-containing protein [Novosphingobium sp. SL115]|uniref:type II secretion system protein N n=1 Tax=Novosphingobium sp. SL115 TaxID=2995150 RepID=UPI002276ABCD|nr:type II secretion system protein N [Novosphingobium sp. SL115]MCY1669709.1 PDZ domain-containing protein [Novosphingobium sp. SL115]
MRFGEFKLGRQFNGGQLGVRSLSLPPLHDVLWWVLALLIAFLGAALVWALVAPVSPLGAWQPAGVRTMSATARAALFASIDPFNRTPVSANGPAQAGAVTSLALTLYATRSTPGGGGTAIIAGGDGVQQVYRTGAEVQPGVTLAAVAFDHVELSHNGARELLYIDQSGPAPSAQGVVAANPVAPPPGASGPSGAGPAGGNSGAVSVDGLRRGVNFGPRAEGGKVVGLEVLSAGDGATFRAAGFQPGDVITAVDGKPVNGPGDAAALAGALRPGASIAVTVKRGDRQLPLAITLAP